MCYYSDVLVAEEAVAMTSHPEMDLIQFSHYAVRYWSEQHSMDSGRDPSVLAVTNLVKQVLPSLQSEIHDDSAFWCMPLAINAVAFPFLTSKTAGRL